MHTYRPPLFADKEQSSSIVQCNEEGKMDSHVAFSHLQVLNESAVTVSGLTINKKMKPLESFTSPALANRVAINNDIKIEVRGQGRCAFPSVQNTVSLKLL